jgi:hypothetical protein
VPTDGPEHASVRREWLLDVDLPPRHHRRVAGKSGAACTDFVDPLRSSGAPG